MSSHRPSPQVVYVAGYGRSGSTLLDASVGNHPEAFGAGELCWLFRDVLAKAGCSCGQPIDRCDFWSEVLTRTFRENPGLDVTSAARISVAAEATGIRRRDNEAYGKLWRSVFHAIAAVSGKQTIVDSSKSTRLSCHRMAFLSQYAGLPVRGIHLVRDPRAVLWSLRRGSNRKLEQGKAQQSFGGAIRGILSWTIANRAVERVRRTQPDLPILRVRYEDLVTDPDTVFAQIGALIDLDLNDVVASLRVGGASEPGHGVAGNRMRRGGPLVLRSDDEWRAHVSKTTNALTAFAYPLMSQYGYHSVQRPEPAHAF